MTSFNDSFARVSFRIYNREDENLNQVQFILVAPFIQYFIRSWLSSWTMQKSNLVGLGPIKNSIGFPLSTASPNSPRIPTTFG